MENKFLGYENEAELVELADADVNGGDATDVIKAITAITNFVTSYVCPTGACTSYCGK